MTSRWLCMSVVLALLAGCAGGGGSRPDSGQSSTTKSSGGRYAMEHDAYPDQPPDVSDVPDAVPRVEPLSRSGNRPTYEVWGKTYKVMSNPVGYVDQGLASWYGEKFQGYATASGEIYDMYKMSAAHRSLPLPTYARVTNIDNNRSVIVKVNDRGPFHDDRLIDLSYAAAARLDILREGTGRVRVEAIDPVAWQRDQQQTRQDVAQAGSRAEPVIASADSRSAGSPSVASMTQATLYAESEAVSQRKADNHRSQPATAAENSTIEAAASSPSRPSSGTRSADVEERLYLQVAALGSATNAQALRERLQGELDSPVRIDSDSRMHRVQVGPVYGPVALEALRSDLRRAGYVQAFTITDSD